MPVDVLIVGGGIGGAVLAHLLTRGGKRVVLIERSTSPPSVVRPEVLWPATVGVLRSLLPTDELERTALLPLEGFSLERAGHVLLRAELNKYDAAAGACWTNPNRTRQLLLEHGSFEVRHGVSVDRLVRQNDHVAGAVVRNGGAEQEILADWTVADDGGHSLIRQQCGIKADIRPFPMELLSFGCQWPADLPAGFGHVWINPDLSASAPFLVFLSPWPGGLGVGLIPIRAEMLEHPSEAREQWERFCSRSSALGALVNNLRFPDDMTRFRLAFGHASHYGTNGAVLMGDALHPVTPAGGQGANLSVADARVLAQLMIEGSSNLIAEYERLRRPAVEQSIALSRRAAGALALPDFVVRRLFLLALAFMGIRTELFAALVARAATAFQTSGSEAAIVPIARRR